MAKQKINSAQIQTPVMFSAYRSAALTPTSGADIVFEIENYDTASCYSTSTGRFTAPRNGYYSFNFQVGLASYTAGNYYWVTVRKNAAEAFRVDRSTSAVTAAFYPGGTVDMFLAAGDTVAIGIVGSSTLTLEPGISIVFFQGKLVAEV